MTSIPRARSSSASARTARPPAVAGWASSSSTIRTRRGSGRVVRSIMSCLPPAGAQ